MGEYMKQYNFIFTILLIMFTLLLNSCDFEKDYDLLNSSPGETRMLDITATSFECIVFGDSGSGTKNQFAVASWMKTYALSNPIQCALMLGDNFYEDGVTSVYDPHFDEQFEDVYNDNLANLPVYVVMGNHDYRGDLEAQILYSDINPRWIMPYYYYSFIYILEDGTKIQFFALDSNITTLELPEQKEQLAWFNNVLTQSTADWKVVLTHHSLYSYGEHGNITSMITAYEDLLVSNNVDFLVSGHDHDLQVIKKEDGPYYAITGASGKLRSTTFGTDSLYAESKFGFATIKFTKNTARYRVIVENGIVDYEVLVTKP